MLSQSSPFRLNWCSVNCHIQIFDMKTFPVTLAVLLFCHKSLGTLVVDLNEPSNEDKNTFLALGKGIEIYNTLTFCLRFKINDVLKTHYIFSSTDDKLVFILRFSVSLGIVIINSVALVFKIPQDKGVSPYHWHHICVSSSESYYSIVLDGKQWYHANHTLESFEKTTLKRLDLGCPDDYWIYSGGINLEGLLSELNIWGTSLSTIQMVKITRNCGSVDPIPDLLNWSELSSSQIRGSKYNENIENICPQHGAASTVHKIIPYHHDQDNAMHVCKILKGELAYPKSLNEFQAWNCKLLRIKCININITKYHQIFCSICIRIWT